jgi:hypothetical protein
LTLDLSAPTLQTRRTQAKVGRGGYRGNKWINPGLPKKKKRNRRDLNSTTDPTDLAPELEDEDAEGEPDDQAAATPLPADSNIEPPNATTENAQQTVQILDLHSDNPIIQYSNHIFSCHWAENIGTELLFSRNESSTNLPALRHLPNGVDLLAASSARLVGTPSTLTTRTQRSDSIRSGLSFLRGGRLDRSPRKERIFPLYEVGSAAAADMESAGDETGHGLSIQVGEAATETRKNQAIFLEELTKIKRAKGEMDELTVIAQRRHKMGWRAHTRTKRDTKGLGTEDGGDGDDFEEMEEEEEEEEEAPVRRRGRKPRGATRGTEGTAGPREVKRRPRASRAGRALKAFIQRQRQQGGSTGPPNSDAGSSATPSRWSEMDVDSQ